MGVKEKTVAELQRRVALLPRELEAWKALIEEKVKDLGIYTSRIEAITDFFDARIDQHKEMVADLEAAPDDLELAYRRWNLEAELGGAHGLMAVFRNIMAQRFDTDRYYDALQASDLIAADCYRSCIRKAVAWKVLKKGQFRVPPLTFLNARRCPQALTRERTFKAFGFDLEAGEKVLRLPFSFVSLRYHDTESIWSFCTIHHEIGHLLDYDLGLESELNQRLADGPRAGIDSRQVPTWAAWMKEMIADAFGVLLGGAGFALALTDTLFLPPSEVLQSPLSVHPPPYLRIFLLGALLRDSALPELKGIADDIEAGWQAIYGEKPPAAQKPFLDQREAIAEFLLSTHLMNTLQNRPLRRFAPHLAQDHGQAMELSQHLRGKGPAPNSKTYPMRLAPAAACLAVRKVDQQHASAYADIHQRALDFALSIPHDEIMGPEGLEREQKEYLRKLARDVRFAELEQRKEKADA